MPINTCGPAYQIHCSRCSLQSLNFYSFVGQSTQGTCARLPRCVCCLRFLHSGFYAIRNSSYAVRLVVAQVPRQPRALVVSFVVILVLFLVRWSGSHENSSPSLRPREPAVAVRAVNLQKPTEMSLANAKRRTKHRKSMQGVARRRRSSLFKKQDSFVMSAREASALGENRNHPWQARPCGRPLPATLRVNVGVASSKPVAFLNNALARCLLRTGEVLNITRYLI